MVTSEPNGRSGGSIKSSKDLAYYPGRLESAYQTALQALLAERTPGGYWVGELSTSALSTATAIGALSLVHNFNHSLTTHHSPLTTLIDNGLRWLAEHQNADGGWGDTDRSLSNISTTMLCRAAFHLAGAGGQRSEVRSLKSEVRSQRSEVRGQESVGTGYEQCLQRAEGYLDQRCGVGPKNHAEAIRARYGKDRTFSVPILMTAALAGLVDWREVPRLPFELACLPQSWFWFLRLPVVSYALPALIAIGQAIHHHRRPWNPITRGIRWLSRKRSLRVLERIQPSSGGFLEAIPLTSFVVKSLASIGQADHPVARKGVEFLLKSVRRDGSWAIDSNLSVWVTTLSINALAAAEELGNLDRLSDLHGWLSRQQFKERHPYTDANPGGWGWTHLPGSVPDADDTAGALVALRSLTPPSHVAMPACLGLDWLAGLQNRDGGWPTFCRGWGKLPFDRSGPDLTAYVLRAIARARHGLPGSKEIPTIGLGELTQENSQFFLNSGFAYLARSQRPDGSWLPLWFGNQYAPNEENPTYGTARVMAAYRDLGMMDNEPARRGIQWLLRAQNPDGSWGGAAGVRGSVEETALAVEVLLDAPSRNPTDDLVTLSPGHPVTVSVERGLGWLVEAIEQGRLKIPEPIGFYFAKLWYYERLYPVIFAVAALGRARRKLRPPESRPSETRGRLTPT